MAAWVALLLLLVAGASLLMRGDGDTVGGYDLADIAVLASGLGLVIFIGSQLVAAYRRRIAQGVRDVIAWSALSAVLIFGYSYREDLIAFRYRVAGDMTAAQQAAKSDLQPDGERAVRIRRRSDGHFMARTEINGTAMPMLIDTGASTVVLRPADAQRLGIDVDRLRYTVPVQTANGTTYAAHVRLKRLAVGPIAFNDVDALVAKPGALKDSLLGMSFLNRLRSFEFAGEFLTLRI